MFKISYDLVLRVSENGTLKDITTTIEKETTSIILNKNIFSYLDLNSGQYLEYDFNNLIAPLMKIKNIKIEKVEQ